ncbi:TetR/AcrR family transcriptional regulator [Mycolicibacterium palauense]|uniref:TetR/AcrR family transcriptional regulator n=1 Tax=Mycolicibacterium palauense TaxID=2034511 RepID=UPI000BFEAA47|nr:TetR family transcriptional regulator [Mycolicibacterium palauense]
MPAVSDRRLRADAARNAERIVRAAREIYAQLGPDAPLEAIAERAGVGERTLYRRFRSTADLVKAALDQSITESIAPAIESARDSEDPMTGLSELIDAAISLGAREHHLLAAARRTGVLTSEVAVPLYEALEELTRRAQQAGMIRPEVVAEDLPRIIAMLHAVLWTMDPAGDGWRRYVALMLDGLATGHRAALPPAVPLHYADADERWPI